MAKAYSFTEGSIFKPLLYFATQTFLAMFLQAAFGAIDLLIVGQFSTSADISAVTTAGELMMTVTDIVMALAVGTTVLIGLHVGEGRPELAGNVIGTSAVLFAAIGLVLSVVFAITAPQLASAMQTPIEAFDKTVDYMRICACGLLFIAAYNIVGAIARGFGDSQLPLIAVAIASAINIAGDLLLVAGFGMGAAGAAIATVFAQALSVVIIIFIARHRGLPFTPRKEMLHFDRSIAARVLKIGFPISLQDLLVNISFLVILAIINSLGLVYSSGVGVAERLAFFLMLVPIAFSQSLSTFVAQNRGAGTPHRSYKALRYAIAVSFSCGVLMFLVAFFKGDMLSSIFTNDADVIAYSAEYLKAYAVDCLLVPTLFCFTGFLNGSEKTGFVATQGIIGAFCVRIPVSYLMSLQVPVSLFHVGLATPCASVVQLAICSAYMFVLYRRYKAAGKPGRQAVV